MNEHKFYIGDAVRYDGGWGKVYDVGPVLPYVRYVIEPHGDAAMVEFPESALQPCCTNCGSVQIEREDYLNPCANAACRLNGPVTYHLGCGSQYREYCADCGALLYDSAQDEIDNAYNDLQNWDLLDPDNN